MIQWHLFRKKIHIFASADFSDEKSASTSASADVIIAHICDILISNTYFFFDEFVKNWKGFKRNRKNCFGKLCFNWLCHLLWTTWSNWSNKKISTPIRWYNVRKIVYLMLFKISLLKLITRERACEIWTVKQSIKFTLRIHKPNHKRGNPTQMKHDNAIKFTDMSPRRGLRLQ